MSSTPAYEIRRQNDYIALSVHAFLIIFFGMSLPDLKQSWQWLILCIEVTSFVYHFAVCIAWTYAKDRLIGKVNTYKWAEYMITATMGTVATGVVSSQNNIDNDGITIIVIMLVFFGVSQQLSGALIDQPHRQSLRWAYILYAFLAQAAEFSVVAYLRNWDVANSGAYWTYVIMWSAFGVLCAFRSAATDTYRRLDSTSSSSIGSANELFIWRIFSLEKTRDSTVHQKLGATKNTDAFNETTDFSEACYSWLGWVSKFSVATAIYYEEIIVAENNATTLVASCAYTMTAIISATAIWQLGWIVRYVYNNNAPIMPTHLGVPAMIFTAGNAVFILISETGLASSIAWALLIASTYNTFLTVPVLKETQDAWAIPHAIFGAVLVSMWAAACTDHIACDPRVAWALTLAVAVLWEIVEWFIVQPLARKLPDTSFVKSVFHPPENTTSPWVDVTLATSVHALLQGGAPTRKLLATSATILLSTFGATLGVVLLLLVVLRIPNRQVATSSANNPYDGKSALANNLL